MRKALVVLCVSGIVTGSALADPEDLGGGVFIAHFPTEMEFSSEPPTGGWCQDYWDNYRIEDCEDQVNRIDTYDQVIWFVLAAWDEEKEWCGTEFGFGDYDPAAFVVTDYGPCWPEDGLEIPTASWPGPEQGTAIVVTGGPWEGNLVPVYWFAGYAYEEGFIPLAVDPATGFAGTANCANPPEVWAADSLGAMGLFADGIYVCPVGAPGGEGGLGSTGLEAAVCCLEEHCRIMAEDECERAQGIFHPESPSCDPDPCGEHVLGGEQILSVCPLGAPYSTIQAALDVAQDGDVIELCCDVPFTGDGNRDIVVPDKAITIRSACDDPSRCILNLGGTPEEEHRGFNFITPAGVDARCLRGVTITHAYHC